MLIDFHTHAFPDKIAAATMKRLSHTGAMFTQTDGSIASLQAEMARDGVDLSVVHCIATNPGQQTNVNNFAITINAESNIVAFGSVHPDAPNALEELERIREAGIQGIKLHPQYQGFYPDDEKLRPVYRKISELGFITLFHSGMDYAYLPPYRSTPDRLQRALKWIDGPVVAAHWGGLGFGSDVLETLCGEDLYFDLSFGYSIMPKPIAQSILDKHGPEKLLFGSDMPWHRPSWELYLLDELEISPSDREKILFRNAQHLLKLD